MQETITRPARGWHLSAGVIVPVALALVAVIGCVGGFVYWSTTNNDNRALERETSLVSHFLAGDIVAMVNNQTDAAISDDIYRATGGDFDRGKVDRQLGRRFYDEQAYEQTYVMDGHDRLVYAMRDGSEIKPAKAADGADFSTLVTRLREKIADGQLQSYLEGETGDAPFAADIMMIGGVPAQVTAIPIAPESYESLDTERPLSTHIAVEYLDDDYAQFVAEQYLLENAALVTTPSTNPDKASYPILNHEGRIVAFYEWQPDRPGRRMLLETVPALTGALAIAALLIVLLLVRLWRYSAALEASSASAQYKAFHDALTGLPNRAMFEASLATALDKNNSGKGFTLMLLDLDRFKQINDTLGHPAGDELIRLVGKRLLAIVSKTGLVARLGGDEFGIIEPSISDPAQAATLATHMVETLSKPFDIFGNEASVGASIGIILGAAGSADGADLVRKSDIALYEAKAAGRNRAMLYEERMGELVEKRSVLEADLRESLRHTRQVSVLFEPVVDAVSGQVIGAEAHPRWVHPRHGEVEPSVFMPVAESSGLMEILGDHILRRAAQLGGKHPDAVISLAISPGQLRNPKFFTRVFDILADTGMRPSNLEMLISESTVTGIKDAAADTLRKFHAAGIRITADNFGTDYSALSGLKQAFVGRVRIEPPEAGEHNAGLAILKAISNLVLAMDIEIGAKSLSTGDQKILMSQIGCTTLQGPGVSPRITADAMETLLATQTSVSQRNQANVA